MAKLSVADAVRAYQKVEHIQKQLEKLQRELSEQQQALVDQLIEQQQLCIHHQRTVSQLLAGLAEEEDVVYIVSEDNGSEL